MLCFMFSAEFPILIYDAMLFYCILDTEYLMGFTIKIAYI